MVVMVVVTMTINQDERSRSYWLVSCSGAFLFFFYQVPPTTHPLAALLLLLLTSLPACLPPQQIFSLYRFKNRWYLRA